MNDIQCQAVAAGFVHALKQSGELRNELVSAREQGLAEIGGLIQKTLGLQSPPSAADFEAMRAYTEAALTSQLTDLRQMLGGAAIPAVVAIAFGGDNPP